MADPRGNVGFEGQQPLYLTLKIDNSTITYSATAEIDATTGIGGAGSASTGLAVTMSADNTVKLTEADETVVGKLITVRKDLFCTVQVSGTCKLPAGSGASVTYGKKIVGALGAASAKGYIKEVATAATPTAAEVNNIAKARHMILDGSTTTAVEVLLGV